MDTVKSCKWVENSLCGSFVVLSWNRPVCIPALAMTTIQVCTPDLPEGCRVMVEPSTRVHDVSGSYRNEESNLVNTFDFFSNSRHVFIELIVQLMYILQM